MSTPVNEIKEKLSIKEVAEAYLKLERAGRNYKARCPFHNEKTPSFTISPDRNTYYCFGCGEHGDIFSLVEHFEGVDFKGALQLLAKRAGVELVRDTDDSRAQKDTEEKLYVLVEEAASFFEKNLSTNTAVREYLSSRGLTESMSKEWRIGYAEDTWRGLYDHLKQKGFPDADIELAGFSKRTEKGWYDRFRGRVMFPIANGTGRIIAFSGRLFPKVEEEGIPKYLNSPETPLFHKSRVLYGLDKAKGVIRKSDFAIVVEGQMDLLMSHQVGFGNTVATSGTSLTEEHLRILKRFSSNVVLAMDGDKAGIASAVRGAALALGEGMNVKIASFPEGMDPADVARKDPELLRKAIRESAHIVDFLVAHIQNRGFDERKFRLTVQSEVFPFVMRISNLVDRAHFIQRLAHRLNLPEDVVRIEIGKVPAGVDHATPLQRPESHEERQGKRSKIEQVQNRLVGMLLIEEEKTEPLIDVGALRRKLETYIAVPKLGELNAVGEEILYETERLYEENTLLQEEVRELVRTLETEYLKNAYTEALGKLKDAERAGDKFREAELLNECARISKALKSIE